MFSIRRPTDARLLAARLREGRRGLSYAPAHCTAAGVCPPGFVADRLRVRVGHGPAAFAAAVACVRGWQQFPAWAAVEPGVPPRVGAVVAVVARVFGLAWAANLCRVIEVIDTPTRYAVTYGTLPAHAERGEERFLVEMIADGGVWYEILAHSRPNHWLAWLGYPATRYLQAKFRRDSAAAVRAAAAVDAREPVAA